MGCLWCWRRTTVQPDDAGTAGTTAASSAAPQQTSSKKHSKKPASAGSKRAKFSYQPFLELNSSRTPRSAFLWKTKHCVHWLKARRYNKLADTFATLEYAGDELIGLTEETALRLGVPRDRVADLLDAIAKLKTQSTGLSESVLSSFKGIGAAVGGDGDGVDASLVPAPSSSASSSASSTATNTAQHHQQDMQEEDKQQEGSGSRRRSSSKKQRKRRDKKDSDSNHVDHRLELERVQQDMVATESVATNPALTALADPMMRSSSRRHSTKSSASSVRSRGSTRSSASARPASDTQTRERVNSQPSRPSPLALHRGISLELDDAPAPDVRDTGSVVTSRTSSIASRKQLQTAEHLTAGPVRDSPDAGFGFDAEDDDDTDANDRNRTQTVTGTHPSSEGLTKYMSEIHLNNDSGPGRKKKTKKNKKNLWIDQSLSGLLEDNEKWRGRNTSNASNDSSKAAKQKLAADGSLPQSASGSPPTPRTRTSTFGNSKNVVLSPNKPHLLKSLGKAAGRAMRQVLGEERQSDEEDRPSQLSLDPALSQRFRHLEADLSPEDRQTSMLF